MNSARQRLIIFAREPQPGRVKTRLIPSLGAQGAADFYAQLLRETVAKASALDGANVELWCDFNDSPPHFCSSLADKQGISMYRQHGEDLGTRMLQAFRIGSSTGPQPTLLIGSDCPGYSEEYFSQAFALLKRHDAVLGPANDGGYVLIGMHRAEPYLFEDIPWSTDEVLELTRARLQKLSLCHAELPALADIDEPGDLSFYPDWSTAIS